MPSGENPTNETGNTESLRARGLRTETAFAPLALTHAPSIFENMIPTTKEEHDKMMGLDQADYGSKAVIKRDVLRAAKAKGYKTSRFHRMPKNQLRAIALKDNQ